MILLLNNKSMKKLCLILIIFFTVPAYGGGWEGSLVKIKKGTLLCDYFNMEKALILVKAKDTDSLNALIKRGSCMKAPKDFIATVVKDASTFTDPNLAEIMYDGESVWGAMSDMDCCYQYKQ